MVKLEWTPKAIGHLKSIYDYISKDSEPYAKRFVESLIAATEKTRQFPEIGRVVPELADHDLREIIFKNHRIVYRHLKSEQTVQILSIPHCKMNFEETEIE